MEKKNKNENWHDVLLFNQMVGLFKRAIVFKCMQCSDLKRYASKIAQICWIHNIEMIKKSWNRPFTSMVSECISFFLHFVKSSCSVLIDVLFKIDFKLQKLNNSQLPKMMHFSLFFHFYK